MYLEFLKFRYLNLVEKIIFSIEKICLKIFSLARNVIISLLILFGLIFKLIHFNPCFL